MPKIYNILPLFILGFFDYIFIETEMEMLKPGESITVGWYVSLLVVNIVAYLGFRAIFKAGFDSIEWPSNTKTPKNRNDDASNKGSGNSGGVHIHITIEMPEKD